MLKHIFVSIASIVLLVNPLNAKPLTLNEVSEAVCRVTSPIDNGKSAMGSGTCISESDSAYFVLTNAHVTQSASSVYVEFFKLGVKSNKISGKVIWRAYKDNVDTDFAIVSVDKSLFGEVKPRVIPLVPREYKIQAGYYISAVGCPNGRWANGWEGRISLDNGSRVIFTPPPVSGQSGTGLTVLLQGADGEWYTRVGAIVTYRIKNRPGIESDDIDVGGAIPISTLYDALNGKISKTTVPVSYKRVSDTICRGCGKERNDHALASDGRLYCIKYNAAGNKYVDVPSGVSIISWTAGCGPNGCPSPTPDDVRNPIFGGLRRPQTPTPQQPSPLPIPPTNGGAFPNLGAAWPGLDKKDSKVDSLEEKIKILEEGKKALEDKIAELNKKPEPAANVVAEVKDNSLLSRFGGVGIGIGAFLGLGIVAFIWRRFVRTPVVAKLDTLEDFLQAKIAAQYGDEYAAEARELMEGIESFVLQLVDNYVQNRNTAVDAVKAKQTEKLQDLVINNPEVVTQRDTGESAVLAALHQVADETNPDLVAKVKSVLDQMKK